MRATSARRNGSKVVSPNMTITSKQITSIFYTHFYAILNTLYAIDDITYLHQGAAPVYINNQLVGSTSTIHNCSIDPNGSGILTITNTAKDDSQDNLKNLIRFYILAMSAMRLFLEQFEKKFADDFAHLGDWSLVADCAGSKVLDSAQALLYLAGLVHKGDDDDDDTWNWQDLHVADFFGGVLLTDADFRDEMWGPFEDVWAYLHGGVVDDVCGFDEVFGFEGFKAWFLDGVCGIDFDVWRVEMDGDEMDGVEGGEEEEGKMEGVDGCEKGDGSEMQGVEWKHQGNETDMDGVQSSDHGSDSSADGSERSMQGVESSSHGLENESESETEMHGIE